MFMFLHIVDNQSPEPCPSREQLQASLEPLQGRGYSSLNDSGGFFPPRIAYIQEFDAGQPDAEHQFDLLGQLVDDLMERELIRHAVLVGSAKTTGFVLQHLNKRMCWHGGLILHPQLENLPEDIPDQNSTPLALLVHPDQYCEFDRDFRARCFEQFGLSIESELENVLDDTLANIDMQVMAAGLSSD